METVFYSDNFIETVRIAREKNLSIGTGNPNAKILIIESEKGFDINRNQKESIAAETAKWEKNIAEGITPETLPAWTADGEATGEEYNPLYPYKGQKNSVSKRDNPHEGTSRTWHNYQKLHDIIMHIFYKNTVINFHEGVFITQLHDLPAGSPALSDTYQKEDAIKRKTNLFKDSAFFQSFPIVIVACEHYPRELTVNLSTLFHVQTDGHIREIFQDKTQWYGTYYAQPNVQPRVLIHTRLLNTNITDGLRNEIGNTIREYALQKKILAAPEEE